MCRDPRGPVAEKILAILETHAGRPEAATEGMLEIMHPDVGQSRFRPGTNPGAVEHPCHGPPPVSEYKL